MIGKKSCTISVILKSLIKVCVFWLSRYICYSIKAKQVKSTRTGGNRSINGMFTYVLTVLLCFKELKEKKINKREEYGENKERNIEEKVFVILRLFLKQCKNERKLMATNY